MCYCGGMNLVVVRVTDLTELRNWLKGLWRERGYSSMSAFAEAAGVAPAAYIGWVERGTKPKRPQLWKVAEFVGDDPERVLQMAGYGPKTEPEEPERRYVKRPRNEADDARRSRLAERMRKLREEMEAIERELGEGNGYAGNA